MPKEQTPVVFLFVTLLAITLAGCGNSTVPVVAASPAPAPAVRNLWTWMTGSNSLNQPGVYGMEGSPSSNNTPGNRASPSGCTDKSGNFWLFGGFGSSDLNDLWEYGGGTWTWVAGSSGTEQAGVYGTVGVAAPGNTPGARYQAVCWTDPSGNFWLFGGLGRDSIGTRGFLNDLWKFNGGQWTWMGGSQNVSSSVPGVYGTQGIASPNNTPGARVDAVAWSDSKGNLWLFGGGGIDSNGFSGGLGDLWKYSNGEWTWMNGPNTAGVYGTYGVEGTPAASNTPGARTNAVAWVDGSDTLWLFGGQGYDFSGVECHTGGCLLNDVWKYSGGQWTWVGGSNGTDAPGTYGIQGTAATSNMPGARLGAVAASDKSGNMWLVGGSGLDRTDTTEMGELNDVWKFNGTQWTWVGGSGNVEQPAVYGTKGVTAISNIPGARENGTAWVDASGNFWIFGGVNGTAIGYGGKLNDLWMYQP